MGLRKAALQARWNHVMFVCVYTTYHVVYHGYGIALVGLAIYKATFFCLYDGLIEPRTAFSAKKFALAQTAHTCAVIASYPYDTIRRQCMHTQQSASVCWDRTVQESGTSALFSGIAMHTANSFLGGLLLVALDYLFDK